MEQSFKIMTLNIHNFCNSEMDDPSPEIAKVIECYDIIALQEVYNMKKIKELVKDYNYSYNRGTLLMTKHPIKEVIKSNKNERFTPLIINLKKNKAVFVTNVHLNYQHEHIRKEELSDILEKIDSYTKEYPSILLGDFNALTKSDYSEKEWGKISRIRKYGKWELPVHELTDELKKEWYDCGSKDKHKTCRYDTRIDYIYTKNVKVTSYGVIQTIPHISDHNVVFIHIV